MSSIDAYLDWVARNKRIAELEAELKELKCSQLSSQFYSKVREVATTLAAAHARYSDTLLATDHYHELARIAIEVMYRR